jgi:predicted NUDIX family NTP pyrophosphohydrolase
MAVSSAGILLHRLTPALEVFIAHMGGPYWSRRQTAAWTIPKGEYLEGTEDALTAARREFAEEIGAPAPDLEYADLGSFRYSSGKTVRVFTAAADGFEIEAVRSNTFEMEWPPRSGRVQAFPEVDRARWVDVGTARELLVAGQVAALDALQRLG